MGEDSNMGGDFLSSLILSSILNAGRGYCARRDLPDGRAVVVQAGVMLNAQLAIANNGDPLRGYDDVF